MSRRIYSQDGIKFQVETFDGENTIEISIIDVNGKSPQDIVAHYGLDYAGLTWALTQNESSDKL